MPELGMITFDTSNALELSQWWSEQLGGVIVEENDGYFCILKAPALPVPLAFQLVPDPTPGKSRVHLDLAATVAEGGREPVVAKFIAGGASLVSQQNIDGFAWDVLHDPHGNVFCVSDPHRV